MFVIIFGRSQHPLALLDLVRVWIFTNPISIFCVLEVSDFVISCFGVLMWEGFIWGIFAPIVFYISSVFLGLVFFPSSVHG